MSRKDHHLHLRVEADRKARYLEAWAKVRKHDGIHERGHPSFSEWILDGLDRWATVTLKR